MSRFTVPDVPLVIRQIGLFLFDIFAFAGVAFIFVAVCFAIGFIINTVFGCRM